jgi:uncharacterized surface protein with fasciclin (FAS1) repeats
MPSEPPRRRITDRDRRRWTDKALDLLDERVGTHAEDIERLQVRDEELTKLRSEMTAFRREFDEWKLERRDDITEVRKDIRELRTEQGQAFARNFREHKAVQSTADRIVKNVVPTRWDKAKDFATILSLLLMPLLVAWLASGGGR